MFNSYIINHQDHIVRENHLKQMIEKLSVNKVDIQILNQQPILITDIRNLINRLSFKPFASKYKVAVIEADYLTLEAQQALLKTLEQPPPHSIIFLSTCNYELLLETIVSRCKLIKITENYSQKSYNQNEDIINFWKMLFTKSEGSRLQIAAQFNNNRDNTLLWLKTNILELRKFLLNQIFSEGNLSSSDQKYYVVLNMLIKNYYLVKHNISLKLALDKLFLYIPSS
jgi:hypothetical protein